MDLSKNARLLRLEPHRSSASALEEHIRSDKVLNLSFTCQLERYFSRLRAREMTSRMHDLRELGRQILPLHPARFQHIVTLVGRALGRTLGGELGDVDQEADQVQDVDL